MPKATKPLVIVVKNPGEPAVVRTLANANPATTLQELQFLVGGYLEHVRDPGQALFGLTVYVDEDAIRKNVPYHMTLGRHRIRGPIVVTKVAKGGEVSLTMTEVDDALRALNVGPMQCGKCAAVGTNQAGPPAHSPDCPNESGG